MIFHGSGQVLSGFEIFGFFSYFNSHGRFSLDFCEFSGFEADFFGDFSNF